MVNYPVSASRLQDFMLAPTSTRKELTTQVQSALEAAEQRIAYLERLVRLAQNTDTRMVDDFMLFLKQVKPDVVHDFHIWLEAKKKVVG